MIPEVIAALQVDVKGALQGAAVAIASEIHNQLGPYPAATRANQPRTWTRGGPNTWYQRGYGSRWIRKDGSVRGAQTSQTLGRRWSVHMRSGGAVLQNAASYSGLVQGRQQTAVMGRIGWKNARTAIQDVMTSGVVDRIVKQALAHTFAAKAGSG